MAGPRLSGLLKSDDCLGGGDLRGGAAGKALVNAESMYLGDLNASVVSWLYL